MNIKENGLETIIVSYLRDVGGYVEGTSSMYDKSLALVKEWLEAFLLETQPKEVDASAIFKVPSETVKFYNRLASALASRGVVDVLRKGFKYNGQTFKLYYELPSELNATAKANYLKNRFGVIRQLHRLIKEEERAIEMQNEDDEVKPIPTGTMNGAIPGVELDKLANIVDDFNKVFGGIDWKDADEVKRQILSLPKRIMFADANFVNTVRQGDTQLAQIAFNDGMRSIVAKLGEEKLEFMKTYFMNEQFRNMVNARVFAACLDKIRQDDGGYAMAAESGELRYLP